MRGISQLFGAAILLASASARAAGPVEVLYAGSLVNLMRHGIGPAFASASGDTFHGTAAGSRDLATRIKAGGSRADVFISADPALDEALRGPGNGNWVGWYVRFATSPLVIGLNPTSRFAAAMRSKPWYQVLSEPGIRIGRTDPRLDPKGAQTLAMLDRAAKTYAQPALKATVLGEDNNPAQVLPEETLVERLQSGALDAAFLYTSETADANIPVIPLPPDVAPSATYTVAVLRDAPDAAAALDFVAFLLGPKGADVLRAHGMPPSRPEIGGDAAAVPDAIRALISNPP